MDPRIKATPTLQCKQCGEMMERHRFSSGRLQDLALFMKRKFCSKKCKDQSLVKETLSSNHKGRWRSRAQKKECCEQCSSQNNLQVHHKDKDLMNNCSDNLQTLCASCHNTLHWKERKAIGQSR